MKTLNAVEKYLEKKGRLFDPGLDNSTYSMMAGGKAARMRVSAATSDALVFKTILPFNLNTKCVRELLVAVNAINAEIKLGKFIVTGGGINYVLVRSGDENLPDTEIAFYLNAAKQIVEKYIQPLTDLNSGKLKLAKFLEDLQA